MKRTLPAAIVILACSCGTTRTSGFFIGPTVGIAAPGAGVPEVRVSQTSVTDSMINCSFSSVLDAPFGDDCPFQVYGGALHVTNASSSSPVLLLSTAALDADGIVEAEFDIERGPSHAVVGLILRAEDERSFLLAGANSRGQYTIQYCLRGMWLPVMGLDAFEDSRLLPYDPGSLVITAEVHGSYVDLSVNGQLIQVVRFDMPATGQAGVFVDSYMDALVDRFSVVPLS